MRAPDKTGVGERRAWKLGGQPRTKDHEAGLAGWLIDCPGAHPFWHWYCAYIVHLRPIEGVRPAVKNYPEAEFELGIWTIDPDYTPDPDPDSPPYKFLHPADLIFQFHGVSDADAKRVLDHYISTLLQGPVSPDADFRRFWEGRLHNFVAELRSSN